MKIHIKDVENTATIQVMSKCCNAKVEFSGGGYDGEDIVPVLTRCSSCSKDPDFNGGTYNIDTATNKIIDYDGVEVPF